MSLEVIMENWSEFPEDFQQCVRFHGHSCPGLALGYAAARAAMTALKVGTSEDEELVAVVENDSCAVDAVQVLLGCTFGKGNLIFRDWGKQVFTVIDRNTGRAVRVSSVGGIPGREERHELKQKMNAGSATEEDKKRFEELGREAVLSLVTTDPAEFFQVLEVEIEMPPMAKIVETSVCDACGEPTMTTKLTESQGRKLCNACAC